MRKYVDEYRSGRRGARTGTWCSATAWAGALRERPALRSLIGLVFDRVRETPEGSRSKAVTHGGGHHVNSLLSGYTGAAWGAAVIEQETVYAPSR